MRPSSPSCPLGWALLLFALLLMVPAPSPASTAADDGAWSMLSPAGPSPVERYGHTAVRDPIGDRMVMFGGYTWVAPAGRLNDAWALTMAGLPQWSQLAPAGTPPDTRFRHSAIHDPVRGRMIVFGGCADDNMDFTGTHFDDVWVLSLGATPTWTRLIPAGTPPAARQLHSAVYDPVGDRMIVFGGRNGSTRYGDVWGLSLGDPPTWAQLAPSGTSPGLRWGHTAIPDTARGRMVVFGGSTGTGGFGGTNDTWALSLGAPPAWTQLGPAGTLPMRRNGHVAIHDPVRDRMIVFGGQYLLGGPDYTNDPWALSLGEVPAWTELSPTGEDAVPPRANTSGVYDPLRDRMVVFAGACMSCGHIYDDTWALEWSTTVSVQLALVSADAVQDLVRLTWYAASGGGLAATVHRCMADGAWSAIGSITADGSGQLVYEDCTVTPGTRYGYRLGVLENGVESFLGEVWVDVPKASGLALAGARPNPATSGLSVSFTLPDPGPASGGCPPGAHAPARLEAFDLAGRRVATREVGALGAGSHVVKLGAGAPLRCGVYVIRLTSGGRTLATRAVIVR